MRDPQTIFPIHRPHDALVPRLGRTTPTACAAPLVSGRIERAHRPRGEGCAAVWLTGYRHCRHPSIWPPRGCPITRSRSLATIIPTTTTITTSAQRRRRRRTRTPPTMVVHAYPTPLLPSCHLARGTAKGNIRRKGKGIHGTEDRRWSGDGSGISSPTTQTTRSHHGHRDAPWRSRDGSERDEKWDCLCSLPCRPRGFFFPFPFVFLLHGRPPCSFTPLHRTGSISRTAPFPFFAFFLRRCCGVGSHDLSHRRNGRRWGRRHRVHVGRSAGRGRHREY